MLSEKQRIFPNQLVHAGRDSKATSILEARPPFHWWLAKVQSPRRLGQRFYGAQLLHLEEVRPYAFSVLFLACSSKFVMLGDSWLGESSQRPV